uniref:DUF4371 domain-containing protein n=1 Tax=Lactuca sativa TaxID=4236 RepID=A0A9R1UD42_LACSA|nr:hypothetical protein LSAT_V11C900458480 [Lactuca sativa]
MEKRMEIMNKKHLPRRPCQPRDLSFQQRDIRGRLCKFNSSWFNDYKYLLEYNKNQCGSDHFVKNGFNTWNKRLSLEHLNVGGPHNIAIPKCQNMMNQRQSIDTAFDKQSDFVRTNQHFLLRQGLPFRGHDESEDSISRGNFLELLQFYVDRNDKVGHVVLKNAPKNPQMTGSLIQNDIVHAPAMETTKVIVKDIKYTNHVIKHVSDTSVNSQGVVVEIFIDIKHVRLSPHKIRGQCYDGGSSMSGAFNGLKTMILKEVKSAHFIHCFAHRLQLTLVFVAKNHPYMNDFFYLISRLLNMIGSSYKRLAKLREP